MITTIQNDEIVNHPFLLAPQSRLWRRVILEQSTPFFLVRYEDQDGDCWVSETAIYWELQALLHFCAMTAVATSRRISQVALITLAAGRQSGWAMQTIKEIWEGHHPESGERIIEYVTDQDLRYFGGPRRHERRNLTKVFSASGLHGR